LSSTLDELKEVWRRRRASRQQALGVMLSSSGEGGVNGGGSIMGGVTA